VPPGLPNVFATSNFTTSNLYIPYYLHKKTFGEHPTMTTVPRASLLGIPTELRLQIYDSLMDEDVNYAVIKRWTGGHGRDGFFTTATRNPEARLNLPWLSAMLSCPTIAYEMRSLMRNRKEGDSKYTTYVMSAELGNGGGDVRDVTWQRLPCAPSDAEVLIIECGAESDDFEPWGDGGCVLSMI